MGFEIERCRCDRQWRLQALFVKARGVKQETYSEPHRTRPIHAADAVHVLAHADIHVDAVAVLRVSCASLYLREDGRRCPEWVSKLLAHVGYVCHEREFDSRQWHQN